MFRVQLKELNKRELFLRRTFALVSFIVVLFSLFIFPFAAKLMQYRELIQRSYQKAAKPLFRTAFDFVFIALVISVSFFGISPKETRADPSVYGNQEVITEAVNEKVYTGNQVSFLVENTNLSKTLSEIRVYATKVGTAPTVTLDLKSNIDGSPGITIGTGVFNVSSGGWYIVDIPDTLLTNNNYFLVFTSVAGDASNYVNVRAIKPNPSDNKVFLSTDGFSWNEQAGVQPTYVLSFSDAENIGNPYYTRDIVDIYGDKYLGEKFTPDNPLVISRISIPVVFKTDASGEIIYTPEDSLFVRLELADGTLIEEGTMMSLENLNLFDTSRRTSPLWMTYNFRNTINLNAGQAYRILLKSPGTTAANAYNLEVLNGSATGYEQLSYDGSDSLYTYFNGTSWADTAGKDISFLFTLGPFLENVHPDFHARLGMKAKVTAVGSPTDKVKITLTDGVSPNVIYQTEGSLSGIPQEITINFRNLSSGNYTLMTELLDLNNNVLVTKSETFSKPYDGVPKVGIDENNGIFVNGQPYFFVAHYMQSQTNNGKGYAEWAQDGYINSQSTEQFRAEYTADSWLDFLNNMQANELFGIGQGGRGVNARSTDITPWINVSKNHPQFAMYQWIDEPDLLSHNWTAEEVRNATDASHADKEHPVKVNLMGKSFMGNVFERNKGRSYTLDYLNQNEKLAADIYGFDWYPIEYWGSIGTKQESIDRLPIAYNNIKTWTKDLVPISAYVEVCDIGNDFEGDPPTAEEVWSLVWINITNGAKMIEWFPYFQDYDPTVYPIMAKTVDYTDHFKGQIMSPNSDKIAKSESGSGRIDYMAKEYNGKLYLFAVNRDIDSPSTATFTITNFSANNVTVYDESREVTVTDGSFSDTFEPMAVHIYEISNAEQHILTYASSSNGTITGSTSQTVSHGSNGTAVTAVPNTGYYFVNWSDGSTANPRTDTNVQGNVSVTAYFAANSTLTPPSLESPRQNAVQTPIASQAITTQTIQEEQLEESKEPEENETIKEQQKQSTNIEDSAAVKDQKKGILLIVVGIIAFVVLGVGVKLILTRVGE